MTLHAAKSEWRQGLVDPMREVDRNLQEFTLWSGLQVQRVTASRWCGPAWLLWGRRPQLDFEGPAVATSRH